MLARASCESTAGPSGLSGPGVGRVLANEVQRVHVLNEPPCIHVQIDVSFCKLNDQKPSIVKRQKKEDVFSLVFTTSYKNALVLPLRTKKQDGFRGRSQHLGLFWSAAL